jgi:hypothetical protein
MDMNAAAQQIARRISRLFGSHEAPPAPPAPELEWSSTHLPREDADFAPIWDLCQPYTMTSFARGLALYRAVRYLVQNRIEGDIVECGVWRGGSIMIALATLKKFGAMDRRIRLFDTFQGMTEPGEVDIDNRGQSADALFEASPADPSGILCYASLDEVKKNVASVGYPGELIDYVVGDIRQTIHATPPRPIALLRLDTDWYDSTRLEMEHLYPQLCDKGVLIIDDYGHWAGSRKAVDEYFDHLRATGGRAPLLTVIDYTGRMAVK